VSTADVAFLAISSLCIMSSHLNSASGSSFAPLCELICQSGNAMNQSFSSSDFPAIRRQQELSRQQEAEKQARKEAAKEQRRIQLQKIKQQQKIDKIKQQETNTLNAKLVPEREAKLQQAVLEMIQNMDNDESASTPPIDLQISSVDNCTSPSATICLDSHVGNNMTAEQTQQSIESRSSNSSFRGYSDNTYNRLNHEFNPHRLWDRRPPPQSNSSRLSPFENRIFSCQSGGTTSHQLHQSSTIHKILRNSQIDDAQLPAGLKTPPTRSSQYRQPHSADLNSIDMIDQQQCEEILIDTSYNESRMHDSAPTQNDEFDDLDSIDC
jgi:hypothetical protein